MAAVFPTETRFTKWGKSKKRHEGSNTLDGVFGMGDAMGRRLGEENKLLRGC